MMEPRVLDGYLRGNLKVNALAHEVVSLATDTPDIYILYSHASVASDLAPKDMIAACYLVSYHLQRPVSLVAEQKLAQMDDDIKMLILPSTSYLSDATVSMLSTTLLDRLVLFGNATSIADVAKYDSHAVARPTSALSWLSNLPSLVLGDTVNASTVTAFNDMMQGFDVRPSLITCGNATSSSGLMPFGITCRSVTLSGDADVLMLVNMRNDDAFLSITRNGTDLDGGVDLYTQLDVAFPVRLAPLQTLMLAVSH